MTTIRKTKAGHILEMDEVSAYYDTDLWDLATDIGNRFEAIREAIADLRKELEAANAKLLDKNTIRNAEYGSFYGKQPSATQVFAAIHLAQAIDKVNAAEWSFGGEINGARHEALNAIVALAREATSKETEEEDAKAAEKNA